MDGPNVTLAFERELGKSREELNRSFQTGAKETNWDLDQYLLKEYKLFKDSPARREDYVKYTGVDIFPSKFCNHR